MRRLIPITLVAALMAAGGTAFCGVLQVRGTNLTDELGSPLLGDGRGAPGADDEIQCLWVGPDGLIDPPNEHGAAGGDDVLLLRVESPAVADAAMGEGLPFDADTGGFAEDFEHALPAGALVYLRAWNGPAGIADCADHRGDSPVFALVNGEFDRIDFGTWNTATPDDDGYVNRARWQVDGQTFEWCAELGSDRYNVYRGEAALLPGDYGSCKNGDDPLLTDTVFLDTESPSVSTTFTYLVSRTAGGIESSLGRNSSGVERLNANPCP